MNRVSISMVRQHFLIAVIVLLLPMSQSLSHAAGRIFYDDFESGNTNLWGQDGTRNRCQVVTAAADGVAGPRAGTRMARCNWNATLAYYDPAAYETLVLGNFSYNNELFVRAWFRPDQNLVKTELSATKIFRYYTNDPVNCDSEHLIRSGLNGLMEGGVFWGTQVTTYYGGAIGDNTASPSSWHKIERYFNQATGQVKTWHDGVLVRNVTVTPGSCRWYPFYLTSNWGDAERHLISTTLNYVYFDEFEVFSDTGSGASGLMSNATISAVPAPPNLRAQ